MDVISIKNTESVVNSGYMGRTTPHGIQSIVSEQTTKTDDVADKSVTAATNGKTKISPIDSQKVVQMTEAMNKFIQAMDAKIHFKIHERSKQLMVQVVDQTNNKVLKEFPSSEFLDTVASIRDFVGLLLDKKI